MNLEIKELDITFCIKLIGFTFQVVINDFPFLEIEIVAAGSNPDYLRSHLLDPSLSLQLAFRAFRGDANQS